MIPAILILLFLGLIPAYIAQTKGRSFGAWYVYGLFLLPITLIHSLLLSSNDKKCPQCAELVKLDAKICKHCGNKFEEQSSPEVDAPKAKKKKGGLQDEVDAAKANRDKGGW